MSDTVKIISSLKNPFIKYVQELSSKSKFRRTESKFIIEGIKELELAVKSHYVIDTLLYCPEIISFNTLNIFDKTQKIEHIEIPKNIFEKLAIRESTGGIIAIAQNKNYTLNDIDTKKNNLIIVCESIEKPGNLGAIFRTADAANADAIILCNGLSDKYNPNVIRASLGCVFTQKIIQTSTTECIKYLQTNSIQLICADLNASIDYCNIDFKLPTAIAVGTESIGLSAEIIENSTQNVIIPMNGIIDSMNVSVATAIITFEAVRQRK